MEINKLFSKNFLADLADLAEDQQLSVNSEGTFIRFF